MQGRMPAPTKPGEKWQSTTARIFKTLSLNGVTFSRGSASDVLWEVSSQLNSTKAYIEENLDKLQPATATSKNPVTKLMVGKIDEIRKEHEMLAAKDQELKRAYREIIKITPPDAARSAAFVNEVSALKRNVAGYESKVTSTASTIYDTLSAEKIPVPISRPPKDIARMSIQPIFAGSTSASEAAAVTRPTPPAA